MFTLSSMCRIPFDLPPLPASSPSTHGLGCSGVTRHSHFGDKVRSRALWPCATSYALSFEFKYSILDFLLACAFHRSTSHRPSYIPTGPTRAMLKRLGTRSAHIWFARCASAPQFTAAGQFECDCPHSVRRIGSHSTSPRYQGPALVPIAWEA